MTTGSIEPLHVRSEHFGVSNDSGLADDFSIFDEFGVFCHSDLFASSRERDELEEYNVSGPLMDEGESAWFEDIIHAAHERITRIGMHR